MAVKIYCAERARKPGVPILTFGGAIRAATVACAFVGLLWMLQVSQADPGRDQPTAPPADRGGPRTDNGLALPTEKPRGAVFFPGTSSLLIAGDGKKQWLRELPEGRELPDLPPNGFVSDVPVFGIALCHTLVIGRGACRLLPLQDGRIAGPDADDDLKRIMVSMNPDGMRMVAYSSAIGNVQVYGRRSGLGGVDLLTTWGVGHPGKLTGIDVDPEGRTVAVAFADGPVEFRDIGTGAVRASGSVPGVSGFCRPVFSPSGKVLAAPSYSSPAVVLFDAADGKAWRDVASGTGRPAWTVAFSPDGQKLATGSLDGEVRLYDIAPSRLLARFRVDLTPAAGKPVREQVVTSLSFSSDGRFLAATDPNSTRVWNVGGLLNAPLRPAPLPRATPLPGRGVVSLRSPPVPAKPDGPADDEATPSTQTPLDHQPIALSVAPDGKTVALAIRGGISLWDLAGRTERGTIPADSAAGIRLSFSADGRSILSAERRGMVRLWDVANRNLRQSFEVPAFETRCVSLSPDGRTVAAAGHGGVWTWDVETGKSNEITADKPAIFDALAFAADGKTLAAGGASTPIVVSDLAGGRPIAKLDSQTPVSVLAFSPDGKTLASGGNRGKVLVWDVAKAAGRELPVRFSWVHALNFSPDGRRLRILTADHLWTWDLIADCVLDQRYTNFGMMVDATPDFRLVVSVRNDNVLRTWDATRSPAGKSAP